MQSGSDPELLKEMYSKLLLVLNLKDVDLGNLRGYSLHLLKMRGVFDTTLSRYRRPDGSGKPFLRNLTLSKEAIDEIEWRFETLKPYMKPGKFDG